jgi:phosphoribosylformylglycinamidine synthase
MREGRIAAAHDISDGGMLRALFEMAVDEETAGPWGLDVDLTPLGDSLAAYALLLSESPGFLLEIDATAENEVLARFAPGGGALLGEVVDSPRLRVAQAGRTIFEVPWSALHRAWAEALSVLFDPGAEGGAP